MLEKVHGMTEAPLYWSDGHAEAFYRFKQETGVSAKTLSTYKTALAHLKVWLGGNGELTAERLRSWRQALEDSGYSRGTVQHYVKRVNEYLRHSGYAALCIPKPLRYDLSGDTFGRLTVLEPTAHRNRQDLLWRCRCSCGREAEFMTSRLISGHTRSCGHCSRAEHMRYRMRIAEDTSIVKALADDALSTHSASGYTGVYRKRDKWMAVIVYKKEHRYLGVYDRVEDAAKARARAKELIVEDGERMDAEYAPLFAQRPTLPAPEPFPPKQEPKPESAPITVAKNRTDNTSGRRGVSRHRDKWYAKIQHKGIRYHLGTYDSPEEAMAARSLAEECVRNGDIEQLKTMHTGFAM